MADGFTCLVRGPSSRYPRGFIWLIPVWFGLVAVAVVIIGRRLGGMPLWLGAAELGGLLFAALTVICVLGTLRRHAFSADRDGIWLGVRTNRRRPKLRQVHIFWPEVSRLRIVPRRYGSVLEIGLGPAARIVHRYGVVSQFALLLGVLFMPLGFGRGRPGLTTARADPPRYLVRICDMTPGELGSRLASVMPPGLPVRVVPNMTALRFEFPPPRRPQRRRPRAGQLAAGQQPWPGQPTVGQPTVGQPTVGQQTASRPSAGQPSAGSPPNPQAPTSKPPVSPAR